MAFVAHAAMAAVPPRPATLSPGGSNTSIQPAPLAPAPVAAPVQPSLATPAAVAAQVLPVGAGMASAGLRLAPATPGAVRFTVTVPAPTLTATGDPGDIQRLDVAGYSPMGAPGGPATPQRIVVVAVPPLGPVRVSAIASELEVHEAVSLESRQLEDRGGHAWAPRNPALFAAPGTNVPVAARVLGVAWLRNQRVARISIEPAAYQPGARRLTLARRVDVDVQVQPLGALGPPAEPNDPFEPVYLATLANYAQGKAWRRPTTATMVSVARRLGVQPEGVRANFPPDTTLYNHGWVKIAISQPGFYAVDYSTLRSTGLFSSQASPVPDRQLRLFTLAGYPLLPEQTFCDSCAMQEVPIGVVDRGSASAGSSNPPDSLFNDNLDYLYFFAEGPSGWASDFDPSLPDTVYLDHPYETHNYYYLGVDASIPGAPRRIPLRGDDLPGGGASVVTTFPERTHFEQDSNGEYWPDANPIGSTLFWEKWFWVSMQMGDPAFIDNFTLPGADATQPARFRLRQWGVTDNRDYLNGVLPCPGPSYDHYLDVTFNSVVFPRRFWNGYVIPEGGVVTYDTTGTILTPGANSVHVQVPIVSKPDCPYGVDRSALAWFDLFYQRTLTPVDDSLAFRSPGAAGPYHYDVGPFPRALALRQPPRLFDITNPTAPVELHVSPANWDTAGGVVRFEDTVSVAKHYLAIPDSMISIARLPASAIADAQPTLNLRDTTNAADYLVIYYDAFLEAATQLATGRSQDLPIENRPPPYKTMIVPVSTLYDQFSGGRTDPAAIRNFLRTAFLTWKQRPEFVMLLGDASFDYKNLEGHAGAGQPGCLLPTYENGFDNDVEIMRQFATDDWLLDVTDPTSFLPNFFGGRLPADDGTTAANVVTKKLLAYEASAPLGEYRNSVVLLADDDMQGEMCDGIGWGHLQQTNALNQNDIPLHMDREYVYLHTYPTRPGGTKPDARNALEADLNNGVTLFNFVGHGSPFKLTDESVFIDTDAGSLQNGNRMFAFVAASCDVGKFDDPSVQSLGELLELTPNGGAIAVVSATEEALSTENANLNSFLYDQLFSRNTFAVNSDTLVGVGQYHVPLSAALLAAKVSAPGTAPINNSKYELLGDPAVTLNLPKLWDDISLFDDQGNPLANLARGQTVTFHGRVLDRPGGSLQPFDGVTSMLIEDSAPIDNSAGTPWDVGCGGHTAGASYVFAAGPIYHGDVSVSGGTFSGKFVVPMDAALGTLGRVRAYCQGKSATAPSIDGAGALQLPVVVGSPPASDTEGPRITLSFLGGAQSVRPDATLAINLFDESGIMTTGHSPQNSIVVTLDGNTTSRTDVTSTFRYAADSYQSGAATFSLPDLSVGSHTVSVQASDNLATGIGAAQHRSTASLDFDVVNNPTRTITRAYLFPDPIRSSGLGAGGTFVVDAPGDSLNTLIRVYTITGRVIRTFKNFGSIGQVQIPWDGRDAEGDPLANGTYLFRVYVNTRQADGTSSASEHALADGKFVVVNR